MKLKNALIPLLLVFCAQTSQAQEYFQQEVDYKIGVRLDDTLHRLKAEMTLVYTNNSSKSLDYIIFHLWPNGYKNNHTALAKQFRKTGATNFQFATEKYKGHIEGLDFKSGDEELKWHYYKDQFDIAVVHLKNPLGPGEEISISTPFEVKLPGDFSRLGHVGQSYQITQWYPKPAVYDKDGWHPMPYLNLGEFYSEYGSFEVKITVPENYRIAATGELQEASEKSWLTALHDSSMEYIDKKRKIEPSSDRYKTITYKQDRIHDFGWFANKNWYVRKSGVTTPGGKKVDTWAFFEPMKSKNWKKATQYLDSAIYYYSKWVGDYPYSAATAVNGALSAGGGMEYPMVTVISAGGSPKMLDNVITHEIGHNWFYGILGSNERTHAWMDEGFNSFIEDRYMKKFYPGHSFAAELGGAGAFIKKQGPNDDYPDWYIAHLLASFGQQAPIDSKSHEFGELSYGLLSYKRPAFLLKYLERYLGQREFDKCMQAYFDAWKFKHPGPDDVKAVFEKTSGKDLDWLFDDLFRTKKQLDYKLSKGKTREGSVLLSIKNTGRVAGPYLLDFYAKDSLVESIWIEGHGGRRDTSFKLSGITSVEIDGQFYTPDLVRENNRIRTKGVFKKVEPLKIDFATRLPDQKRTRIHVLPIMGTNSLDKYMLGASFHNQDAAGKRFQYYVSPMYSFGQERVVGSAHMYRDFQLLSPRWNKVRLRVTAKHYAGFNVIRPSVKLFTIDRRYRASNYTAESEISYNYIQREPQETLAFGQEFQFIRFHHTVEINNSVLKRKAEVRANYFADGRDLASFDARLVVEWKAARWLTLRGHAFTGLFVGLNGTTNVPNALAYFSASSRDYGMHNYLMDRQGNSGYGWLGTNQVLQDQGMMNTENIGGTNLTTFGLNMKFRKIPLEPYFNMGMTQNSQVYDAGFGLNLGFATVYLPAAGTTFSQADISSFKQYASFMRYSFNFNVNELLFSIEKVFK